MMFRQSLVLLIAVLVVSTPVDARAHIKQHKASSQSPRHITAKAHNYHARYYFNDKSAETALLSETKNHESVKQEFTIGSRGGFEQNVHIPPGKAHDLKFRFENGTLDVFINETQAVQQPSNKLRRDNSHTAAFAAEAKPTFFKKYTTEQTLGLAALALSVLAVISGFIGAIVTLLWSNTHDAAAASEAVAPQSEDEVEAEAEAEAESSTTEEEYEEEFNSETSEESPVEQADNKESLLRDEEMESIEASV